MSTRKTTLTGMSVSLVEMTESDQSQFCAWQQSSELRALIDDPRVPTLKDQMQWFMRVQKPDRRFFSLVTVPDGQLIGHCGFVDIDPARQEATLRITIGNPEYLGKGLGSEAVQLLVRYGFESMSLQRILLKVLSTNARALRTYEKIGFLKTSEETKDGKTTVTMTLLKPVRT